MCMSRIHALYFIHTPCACILPSACFSGSVYSYIHLMSTTQLDRSRSPTMPCILLVYIPIYLYIYTEKSLPDVRLGWLAPARQLRHHGELAPSHTTLSLSGYTLSPARDLSHALNYKRVWRGERERVISIHEALTNQIAVQNPCHGSHLGASIVSRSSCQVGVMKTN